MIVGLTQIRGVGYMFANTILNVLKISPNQRIGYLSQEQIKSIENIIKNPFSFGNKQTCPQKFFSNFHFHEMQRFGKVLKIEVFNFFTLCTSSEYDLQYNIKLCI